MIKLNLMTNQDATPFNSIHLFFLELMIGYAMMRITQVKVGLI